MNGTRGRPRSEQARKAVLEAAMSLCDQVGYQAVTLKGIASLAGVGRQTIYRWWSSRPEVMLEAVIERVGSRDAEPPDTGDPMLDVQGFLHETFVTALPLARGAVVGLMTDAQQDPDFAEKLQARLLAPRRAALRELLARGRSHGTDLDLVVDLMFGTMWYRLLSRHAPVDDTLAEQLTDMARKLCRSGGE